jgi:hypothetical protein
MKKLRLRLDDLRIDSFQTTQAEQPEGTVFGEQCTCHTQCTCPGCPTCYASCNGTCDASCNGSCNCSGDTCNASCFGTCEETCDNSCGGTCGYTSPGPGYECQIYLC